jgi:hypothetical protein
MTATQPDLRHLRRAARVASLRLRLNEALRRGARWAVVFMAWVLAALTIIKVAHPPPSWQWGLLAVAIIPLGLGLGVIVHALVRKRPWYAGSLELDRHHGLSDRVTSALAFARETEITPLMCVAIEDALGAATEIAPRKAVPLRLPRDLGAACLLGVAVFGLSLLEVQTERWVSEPARSFEAFVVASDDLELFRELTREVDGSSDPEVTAAVERLNQLVEDLADARLDRREAFRRLEAIDSGLLGDPRSEAEAALEALKEIGEALARAKPSEETGRALVENRLPDASEAMKKLADRLEQRQEVDPRRLEELREALRQTSQRRIERAKTEAAERAALEERRRSLLEKKSKEPLNPREQEELRSTERRLERLDREKKKRDSAKDEVDPLDRELAKAAEQLRKELGEAGESLRRGAEHLNRSAQKQMTRREKEELKKRLDAMREVLRQEGPGGKKRLEQMMRFGERARGGEPTPGQPGGAGRDKSGEAGEPSAKPGGPPRTFELRPGGSGDGPSALLPGGSLPMPGSGDDPGNAPGGGSPGEKWGGGHDPSVAGEATGTTGELTDVAAAAADTGQGVSASESIYGAAERGFVGKGYRRVFTDYVTVAEEVLARDEIPPGYEFYVRRYFQLIRPRE